MSDVKHTPGPWSLNKYDEPVDHTGENIHAKGLTLTNSDEARANSRLISAAPELLAALKSTPDDSDYGTPEAYISAVRNWWLAEAAPAISKAEGRAP